MLNRLALAASESFAAARTQEMLVLEMNALSAELETLNAVNAELAEELEYRSSRFSECMTLHAQCDEMKCLLAETAPAHEFADGLTRGLQNEADRVAALEKATQDAETAASALSTWMGVDEGHTWSTSSDAAPPAPPPLTEIFLGEHIMSEASSLRIEAFAAFKADKLAGARTTRAAAAVVPPILDSFDERCAAVSDRCHTVLRTTVELLSTRQSQATKHAEFTPAMIHELEIAFDGEMQCLDAEAVRLAKITDESNFHMWRGSGTATRPRSPDAVDAYHLELARSVDADLVDVHRRSQLRIEHELQIIGHEVRCLKEEKTLVEKEHRQRATALSLQHRSLKKSLEALSADAEALKATNETLKERHLLLLAAKNTLEVSSMRNKWVRKPK
jgi:hypothetical protein